MLSFFQILVFFTEEHLKNASYIQLVYKLFKSCAIKINTFALLSHSVGISFKINNVSFFETFVAQFALENTRNDSC